MNTSVLKTASEHGGPIILGAGIAMLTVALITTGHDGRAQAAPAPTVTVTPPPAVVTAAPSAAPRPRPSATLVVDRTTAVRPESAPRAVPSGPARSSGMASEQAPHGTASPPHCTGRILALQVRLAALPDCITLGGSR